MSDRKSLSRQAGIALLTAPVMIDPESQLHFRLMGTGSSETRWETAGLLARRASKSVHGQARSPANSRLAPSGEIVAPMSVL
jgi:hypothetical protein